jgi:hypothetical protein
VSPDGTTFTTVATLDRGTATATFKDNRVRAIRIRAAADQTEPLVVRAINVRPPVVVSGVDDDPHTSRGGTKTFANLSNFRNP